MVINSLEKELKESGLGLKSINGILSVIGNNTMNPIEQEESVRALIYLSGINIKGISPTRYTNLVYPIVYGIISRYKKEESKRFRCSSN